MKRIMAIMLILGIIGGCATQQSYRIPSDKTRADYMLDKAVCENFSGYKGGYVDSGPLIILFPIVKAFDFIEGNHQKDFQKCMTERGYHCTGECWDIQTSEDKMPQSAIGSEIMSPIREIGKRIVAESLLG